MPFSQQKPTLLNTLVRHYEELVSHVRHRFGDRVFAREVIHNVCVQLLIKRDKENVQTPLALLRKISLDQALDQLRSERRNQQLFETLSDDNTAITEASILERHYEVTRELELLAQAIHAMPHRRQVAFIMHKIHEIPQPEVAARMGISIKAVEKHVSLGMISCRMHLERGIAL